MKFLKNILGMLNDFICMLYPKYCEDCGDFLFKFEDQYCLYCRWKFPWNISDKKLEKLIENNKEIEEYSYVGTDIEDENINNLN